MITYLKKIFLEVEFTVIALFLIATLAIIGALNIYFSPEAYNLISTKPLFQWMLLNFHINTLWLYLITFLFGFVGITGIICSIKDMLSFRLFPAIYHLSFLLVLLAHLITAIYGFRLTDIVLPQSKPETIAVMPPHKPLKIFFRDVTYNSNSYGIPTDIKAQIIYLDGKTEKEGVLTINNPIKISDFHLVLKDLANYLVAVNLSVTDGKKNDVIPLLVDQPYIKDDYRMDFLAHNQQFSQIKIMLEEKGQKEVLFLSVGSNFFISNKSFRVTAITPVIVPAIVVDVSYDPALMLIFYASTIFTILLTFEALKRGWHFFYSAK